jgi:hypothetical protein
MNSWANPLERWWHRPDYSGWRLLIAVVLSIAFHVTLLMLQFGEYGEGLPGFELPSGDRRARMPDLHMTLQNPIEPRPVTAHAATGNPDFPVPALPKAPPAPVSAFDVIPTYRPAEAPPAATEIVAPPISASVHVRRTKPKLLTSAGENADFKVAESDQLKLEPAMPEEDKQADTKPETDMPAVVNSPLNETVESDNQEKQLAEKIAAEKLAEEKQAQEKLIAEKRELEKQALVKEQVKQTEAAELAEKQKRIQAEEQDQRQKLAEQKREEELKAARELESQRKAQLAAQLVEKLKQDELARQLAQAEREKVEREKTQQALMAERIAEEQRKLAQAVREDQLKQELAKREQQERDLAEKKRLETEEIKHNQEQQQLAEQARQRETARQLELSRAAVEALAKGKAAQSKQSDDLNDILGTTSGAGANAGAGKQDLDKLLSGRSSDFDKNSEAIRSSAGTTIPVPKFDTSPGARRSIFGSKNGDVDLNLYILSWRQKIESNGRLNYSQLAKDKVLSDPIVIVSVRSNGSVENIVILRSSGRKEIDDAVRRIATVNAPYSAFPPSLARKYDVVDIRQIWVFDESLHVTDEVR